MRLLGNDLNLIELKLDGGLTAEHGNDHVHRVVITVYADRSFTFITKTPPTPLLVMKAIGLDKGSGVPNKTKVGTITKAQITEIAKTKMPDLNVNSLEAAESQVAGTCRSMGVTVVD